MFKRVGLLASAIVFSTSASAVVAAETFQPWQAFGEDTIGVVNIPQSPEIDELSSRTKAYQLFNPETIQQRFVDLFKQQEPELFATAEEQLTAVGLKWEDFGSLLSGPMGAGVQFIPASEEGENPDVQVTLWLTPGEEQADKFIEAITAALEMQTEPEERRITRVDHSMEDMTIMQFNGPSISSQLVVEEDGTTIVEDLPTTGDQPVVLLLRDAGRFYISIQEQREDNEINRQRLASFVQSVKTSTVNAFSEKVQAAQFIETQLPDGLSTMDLYFDPQPLLKLIPDVGDGFGPSPAQIVEAMGIESIKMLGLRSTLSEGLAQLGMALETDGPLQGLLGMLNQDAVDPIFPDWIPADVVDARKVQLDMSKLYTSIQEMVRTIAGDQAEAGFQQANMGATMYLGMDLPSLFGALGETHYFVTYPTEDDEILAQQGDQMDMGSPMAGQSSRVGWVQEVRDVEGANQFMTGLMNTMNMFGVPVDSAKGQGFSGWRLAMPELGDFSVGMMMGQGQLMTSFDEFSSTHTLNYLVNPPEAEARLNTDPAIPLLMEYLPEGEMTSFTFQNTGLAMREAVVRIKAMVDMMEPPFGSDDDPRARGYSLSIGLFKALIPSPDDAEAAWGKTLSSTKAADRGFSFNAVMALPLADL